MLAYIRTTVASAAIVGAVAFGAGNALAVPVHTSNTDVTSWDVGSGQVNGNFSVTFDAGFIGGPIEIGLRAEQRRVGAVVPTAGDNYLVQPGEDPGTGGTRAWWNFQASIAYGSPANPTIDDLTSLTLTIVKDGGTNSAPAGTGIFDLLAVRGTIDDRNVNGDGTFSDIYQISQNPLFGWFDPQYDLSLASSFAYFFDLTAVGRDGSIVSTSMCVHTGGLACTTTSVPEPGTLGLMGAGLAALGLAIRRRRTA